MHGTVRTEREGARPATAAAALKIVSLAAALLATRALAAQKLYIRNYTPEDGLAASQVFRIDQDAEGQMWFATSEGVSRYDGVNFTNFTRASGLANQTTRVVVREPGGRVWFGTNSGVTAYDGRHITNYDGRQGLGAGVVWCATVDHVGRPWFGTQSGGVSVFTGEKFITYTAADGLPENYIYALLPDRDGRLWIGTRHEGVAVARIGADGRLSDIHRFTAADGMTAKSVRALAEDADGMIYLGTRDDGVFRYDGKKFSPLTAAAAGLARGADVYALALTHDGELAVGIVNTGVTLCALPAFRECRQLTERNGLRTNQVLSLFSDREGCLWVGLGSGVSKLVTDKFENYFRADGLSHNVIQAVLPVSAHEIWLGTQGGVTRLTLSDEPYRGAEMFRFTAADGLPDDEVWAVQRDHAGRLWFGTRRGLCLYRPGKGCTVYTVREGLLSNYVVEIQEDTHGDLWIGTDEGLTRLRGDPDRGPLAAASWTLHDGLPGSQIYSMVEDGEGALWLSTSGGLSRFKDGKFRNFTTAQGLPVDTLNKIIRSRDGMLWAGSSGGGLIRIDPRQPPGTAGAWTIFDTRAGLPSNSVITVTEDRRGMLWLGTLAGAVEFDPREAHPGGHPVQRLFDQRSGLASNEAPTSNAAGIDPEGNLWFGLTWGVTRYLPLRDQTNPVAPRVAIARLRVNGQPYYAAPFTGVAPADAPPPAPDAQGGFTLAAGVREVAFEYRGLSFRDESEVRFQTRLKGYDPDWSPESAVPFREYTNLDPGSYVFEVRARNGDGVWNTAAAQLPLRVAPAFWQRQDVRGVLLLLALLLLFGLGRLRTASIRKRNRVLEATVDERTREVREYASALEQYSHQLEKANLLIRQADRTKSRFLATMSHELRTPLNSIIGFSDVLADKLAGRVEAREIKFLRNIQESGRHLLGLINNILDLSKIEAGKMEVHVEALRLEDLIESVRNVMTGMAGRRGIELTVRLEPALPVLRADGPKIKQMLYNLLSNAIKYSPDQAVVEITARGLGAAQSPLGEAAVEIAVRDHGAGIAQAAQAGLFEEFHQAARGSEQNLIPGTGLGLAIVRKFAEIQGGRVEVDSTPGVGSVFRITLPLVVRPPDASGPARAGAFAAVAPSALPADESDGPRILVVEDEADTREQLCDALRAAGYEPFGAARGEEALALARGRQPAVITLDLILPGIEGWEVLKALKGDAATAGIPVVIVSLVENRELGLALGADDYFLKPLEWERFFRRLADLAPPAPGLQPAVLVIDDDAAVRDLLRERLSGGGYTPVCTESGAAGIELAATIRPAAIILDLMMPGVDGFEVAAALRRNPLTAAIPVLILSAKELTNDDRARLDGRITALFAKGDNDPAELLRAIAKLAARKR